MKRSTKIILILLAFILMEAIYSVKFPVAGGDPRNIPYLIVAALNLETSKYAYVICMKLLEFLVIGLTLLLIHPAKNILSELGLSSKGFACGCVLGFLLTLPMFIVNAACGHFEIKWYSISRHSLLDSLRKSSIEASCSGSCSALAA